MTEPLRPDRPTGSAPRAREDRAGQRAQLVAERAGSYQLGQLQQAVRRALADPERFPDSNIRRWVPAGPSVIGSEIPSVHPRATGRVRDIAVSGDGVRAYAASAKGGVWYTGDAGATWSPVGGWAERSGRHGGSNTAQACCCLLVAFGTTVADDFVMVGTGEHIGLVSTIKPDLLGLGVLAARAAAVDAGAGGDPWEEESGVDLMEGLGVFRLARQPGATPGAAAADAATGRRVDRVLAATSRGLFLGTRRSSATGGAEFGWVARPALDVLVNLTEPDPAHPSLRRVRPPIVTDVVWLDHGTDGRIVVAFAAELGLDRPITSGSGVAYSDDLGLTFHWVRGLNPGVIPATSSAPPVPAVGSIVGRLSLAHAASGRVYVLGAVSRATGRPSRPAMGQAATVWRIAAMFASTPTATGLTRPTGAEVPVWPGQGGPSQRDYDQAIAVEPVTGTTTDRIYLGGSYHRDNLGGYVCSLWCFDVDHTNPSATLWSARDISKAGLSDGGVDASADGLIGDNVHMDVHAIRLIGDPDRRQVWVACDGGVFVSTEAGRVYTFAPRVVGLAALEVNYVAVHPRSSQFMANGTQDNGRLERVGDSLWHRTVPSDGGGVVFHPRHAHAIVSQLFEARWVTTPPGYSTSSTTHRLLQVPNIATDRESRDSAFYSGAAAVASATAPSGGRIAVGTYRVWLSDDVGQPGPPTWRVLPFPSGAVVDARPLRPAVGGAGPVSSDPRESWELGVPQSAQLGRPAHGRRPLGVVRALKWASPTELLVLFRRGVLRWTESPAGQWSAELLVPPAASASAFALGTQRDLLRVPLGSSNSTGAYPSDLGPVPATRDFYLVTAPIDASAPTPGTDTCLYYHHTAGRFYLTGLRGRIDPSRGLLGPADSAASPPGPLDPAYAVVVDPTAPAEVYVGTVTGVWRGVRSSAPVGDEWPHRWELLANGLPQTAVQDLGIWVDPSGSSDRPRLLRAALQSRGVWELDLAATTEPRLTYLRAHRFDDRRVVPTPMANPRRPAASPPMRAFASPDIVVRPTWPWSGATRAPAWWTGGDLTAHWTGGQPAQLERYQLWTFQTAFRWLYPSVLADGRRGDPFGAMVRRHRRLQGWSDLPIIDQALWDLVVGQTHLNAATGDTRDGRDPLAVYRAPWHTPAAMGLAATEIDTMQCVVPPGVVNDEWQVYREHSTVDVLVHHRDTRPVPDHDAFVLLLLRSARLRDRSELLTAAANAAAIPGYLNGVSGRDGVLTAEEACDSWHSPLPRRPGPLPTLPSGWRLVPTADGRALHRLPVPLDARLPRAVSIDVDLTNPAILPAAHSGVLLLAIAASTRDVVSTPGATGGSPLQCRLPAPIGLPPVPTPADLVRHWPYAAMRLVRVIDRP